MTHIETRHFFRLKAAMHDLIEMAGGIERAAVQCGYSKSSVHRWASREHPDMMPVNAIVALEADTGTALITAALCAINGMETIPAIRSAPHVMGAYVNVAKASAVLGAEMAVAVRDGILTPLEQDNIDHAAAEVGSAAEHLRGSIAAAGGRPVKVAG